MAGGGAEKSWKDEGTKKTPQMRGFFSALIFSGFFPEKMRALKKPLKIFDIWYKMAGGRNSTRSAIWIREASTR